MAKSIRIPATFGPLVFAHPHLTSPDTEGQYADNKYKVDGAGDPTNAAIKTAKVTIAAACKTLGVDAKVANLPIKEQTEKNEQGTRVKTGKLIIRAKSQFAPGIVDAAANPIPAKTLANLNIGAGSEGFIEGYLSSYVLREQVRNPDGSRETVETPGVSFTLTGIQLIKLQRGGGGKGGNSFTAYEGGGFTVDDDADSANETLADDSGLNLGTDTEDRSSGQGDGGVLDI